MGVPLPPELGGIARLQELRLANSGYSGSIPETFGLLSSLTTLSLQNNNLTDRIPLGLSRLKRMYHLNLSKNGLDGAVPRPETRPQPQPGAVRRRRPGRRQGHRRRLLPRPRPGRHLFRGDPRQNDQEEE